MPTDYKNAVDELFGIVNAVWPQVATICGYTPQIRWPGQPKAAAVPMDQLWARVSTQIVKEGQSALANADGKRKYHAVGLLYIQLFCPRTVASTLDIGRQVADLVKTAFRQPSASGILWFRDQKVVELPSTEENYPINVVVTFEYDDVAGAITLAPIITPQSGAKKHYPVEAPDGVRTSFTFTGLPSDANNYVIVWNGLIQDGFEQTGNVIEFGSAPDAGAEVYGYY